MEISEARFKEIFDFIKSPFSKEIEIITDRKFSLENLTINLPKGLKFIAEVFGFLKEDCLLEEDMLEIPIKNYFNSRSYTEIQTRDRAKCFLYIDNLTKQLHYLEVKSEGNKINIIYFKRVNSLN